MRKRIVVAILATAAIGVVAYVVWQPKEGSPEWHARRYADCLHALSAKAVPSKVERLWHVATGQRIELRNYEEVKERLEKHKSHLKESGFLTERTFYGVEDINQCFYIRDEVKKRIAAKRLRFVELRGAFNSVTITTASQDMPICEKIVAESLRLTPSKARNTTCEHMPIAITRTRTTTRRKPAFGWGQLYTFNNWIALVRNSRRCCG